MNDELDHLRRSNQVQAESLEPLVGIERRELLDMLETDADERSVSPLAHMLSRRPSNRVGYLGAMAAAAAVLVAMVFIADDDVSGDVDAVEIADEVAPEEPLVIDGVSSTTGRAATPIPVESSAIETGQTGTSETETSEIETGASSNDNASSTTPSTQEPSTTSSGSSNPEVPPTAPTIDGPFNSSADLLSLHYDFAHLDDGHATVAALELATTFGLEPHVVAGTYRNGGGFVHDFEAVMQATWGDRWFDAHLDRPVAIEQTVARWLATMDSGGRVWVAEGGVSDFTAEVVREIRVRRPGLDTTAAIHVVQHNTRNESEADPVNLQFLLDQTQYVRIDDGNDTNATANLNQPSDTLAALAESGPHRASWAAAFEELPSAELDFSDTVEVLHILGLGIDVVANPDDFADRFMR